MKTIIQLISQSILFPLFLFFVSPTIKATEAPKNTLPETSIYHVQSEWINQNGKPIKLTDFKNKIVIASMIYMSCQSSCPLTVAKMKEVEKLLSAEVKSKVQFVLFTFDIKRDTPAIMKKYATKHHLDLNQWNFLTNKDESNVRELSTLIDFKYKHLPNGEFEHSFAIVGLDTEGRIIGRTEGAQMDSKVFAELINKAGSKGTENPAK